jgi:hypothetical protein
VPQLAYFAGVGLVLAYFWLTGGQKGSGGGAPGTSGAGGQRKGSSDGGAPDKVLDAAPGVAPEYGSYQYNYGEVSGPDASSPYGGTTDNRSTSSGVTASSSSFVSPAGAPGSSGGLVMPTGVFAPQASQVYAAPPTLVPYTPPAAVGGSVMRE